mgnify:CR=1 FL=1
MTLVISPMNIDTTEGMDKITSTDKITTGYHSDNTPTLTAANLHSASLSDTNEVYYHGIAKGNVTGSVQWYVSYGNVNGKGGNSEADVIKSSTEAIYKQWTNTLLPENEVTGGFFISSAGSDAALSTKEEQIYVLVARRELMKDRLNKKNWSLVLSGSDSNRTGSLLHLTDDSATVRPTATPAGPRYNIVSGSNGTVTKAASVKTYGHFYPDQGVLVFSGAELSASLPGSHIGSSSAASYVESAFTASHHMGFGFDNSSEDADYKNSLRFVNCLKPEGASITMRDEEDLTSVSYFCRVRAGQANFSNSPSFVSGSLNEIRHQTMKGNPTTYITEIGLHDAAGNCVATGKLSSPLKNNFSSEATIKVKLTY